jgi:hypothetical protein
LWVSGIAKLANFFWIIADKHEIGVEKKKEKIKLS